jgi:hypothetical protein
VESIRDVELGGPVAGPEDPPARQPVHGRSRAEGRRRMRERRRAGKLAP